METQNRAGGRVIEQDPGGYRYSIEPFLLADFVELNPGFSVLDIGTGCCIIPLLLTTREPRMKVMAVEIQPSLYELAVRNVRENGFTETIQVLKADFLKAAPDWEQETLDLVLSNPPYRKVNTGRMNPNREKAIARHELTLDLGSLVKRAASLLKPNGRIALAYPPHRLSEVLKELEACKLYPSRVRFIHGYRGTEAKIFLVEAVKGRRADCVVQDPLYVYNKGGDTTREMEEIYASFNNSYRPNDLGKEPHGGGPG